MKKLLYSLIFILLGVFAVDRLGGMAMWWVNQHTQDLSAPKIKYLSCNVKEDVIMMGASRCELHYVPSIISDSIGMSVYNGGINASNDIYAHYIMLNLILSHHIPKVICLEIMKNDYEVEKTPFATTSFFAPYFGRNEHVDSVFRQAGLYWRYKVSHLYRFNAKAVSNIAGLAVSRNPNGDNGYYPMAKPPFFPSEIKTLDAPVSIDKDKLHYIQRFIDICKENGIKLFFVVSPNYTYPALGLYDVIRDIAHQNDIVFINCHSQGLFLDHPEFFMDSYHLWDDGARKYSSIFASELKRYLNH